MAISVEDIHKDIRSQLKKHTSGFVSPEDIDNALNKASIDILKNIVAEYRFNKNINNADYELLVSVPLAGSTVTHALPDDIFSIVGVFDGNFEGDILNAFDFNNRRNSLILAPTKTRPVATIYNNGGPKIDVLPASGTNTIKYWKNPTPCVYAYTVTSGVIAYSAGGSTDLEFPLSYYTDIINRALVYLTPSAKNVEAAQLETQIK